MPHDVDRFAAFKAWRAEQKAETAMMPAFGSEWEFPARMPAALWLWIQEHRAAGRRLDVMTDADIWDLLHIAVPDEVLAEWRKLPLSTQEMAEAVVDIVQRYTQGSGEAPAPETGPTEQPSTSSPTGSSSKPTSPESTDSTSPSSSPEG